MSSDLNALVTSVLRRCRNLRHLQQLQSYLLTLGHGGTQFYIFKLVRFSILSLSDLSYARRIFDALPSPPNSHLYAALLSAYSSLPNPSPALHLFIDGSRHVRPSPFTLPPTLNACNAPTDTSLLHSLHSLSFRCALCPQNSVVLAALVDAYTRFSDFDSSRKLLSESSTCSVAAWTALLSGYAKAGLVGNALSVFEQMPQRDVPSWNAAISACTQNGFFGESTKLFRRMVGGSEMPNSRTFACVLPACSHLGLLWLGKSIHGFVVKNESFCSPFVSNAIVDMYGKCGSVREARLVFYKDSDRSLAAWNTLINGLALQGHSKTAIETFKEMEMEGVAPDAVTFVGLLSACTHGGFVEEGLRYFNSMLKDYGIMTDIQHYGCVVDLLGRAGRFHHAVQIIQDMKVEPDEVIWGALLNGCRVHGATELAKIAIKKLLEIDSSNIGYGVMLANLYSEQGKWNEVGKVRRLLNDIEGKKLPGCSWVEVDREIHQFSSGDKIHPKAEAICDVLEALVGHVEV